MKKAAFGAVFAGVALVAILVLRVVMSDTTDSTDFVYHKLLADPEIYDDGEFSETFQIPAGDYKFKFIPNGDSPEILSISLSGDEFSFSQDFMLEGTAHKSAISEYYTWDYLGQKEIQIMKGQTLEITINPNGNTIGTFSVMIGPA